MITSTITEPFMQSGLYLIPLKYYDITIKFTGNTETFTYKNVQFIEFNKTRKALEFGSNEKQKYGLYNMISLYPHEIIKTKELTD